MDPSRSRTWGSKLASERRSGRGSAALAALAALVGAASVSLGGCDSAYPLAATICDDYCLALQRGDCKDDEPADCVRDCEATRRDVGCDEELQALGDCYAVSARSGFVCEDNHTRVLDVCLDERRAYDDCATPGSGACFEECLRQSEACQGSLDDCELGCLFPPPGCEDVTYTYNACLQEFPVECRVWGQPDPRPPEEIPCFDEALALLACYE